MKKILTLEINLEDDNKTISANLKHCCASTQDALNIIKEFVARKSRNWKNSKKKGDA